MPEISPQTLDLLRVAAALVGGFASAIGVMRLLHSDLRRQVDLWKLDREVNRASDQEDQERLAELELLYQHAKLYSSDIVKQGTAIRYLAELRTQASFTTLLERFGSPPALCDTMRSFLLNTIIQLVQEINNAGPINPGRPSPGHSAARPSPRSAAHRRGRLPRGL